MRYASFRLASPIGRNLPVVAVAVYALAWVAEVMTRGVIV